MTDLVPAVPAWLQQFGWEPTGEFREPKAGEFFWSPVQNVIVRAKGNETGGGPRFLVRKIVAPFPPDMESPRGGPGAEEPTPDTMSFPVEEEPEAAEGGRHLRLLPFPAAEEKRPADPNVMECLANAGRAASYLRAHAVSVVIVGAEGQVTFFQTAAKPHILALLAGMRVSQKDFEDNAIKPHLQPL